MSLSAAVRSLSESPAAATDRPASRGAALGAALIRAQRGEVAAFRELIRAYQDTVYSLALRMLNVPEDAEELAQRVRRSQKRRCASEVLLPRWRCADTKTSCLCHRAIDRLRRRPALAPVALEDTAEIPAAETGSAGDQTH